MALERGHLDVIVNISQMTVSQMTLTSTGESKTSAPALAGRARAELVGATHNPNNRPRVLLDKSAVHHPGSTEHPGPRGAVTSLQDRPHVTDRRSRRRRKPA